MTANNWIQICLYLGVLVALVNETVAVSASVIVSVLAGVAPAVAAPLVGASVKVTVSSPSTNMSGVGVTIKFVVGEAPLPLPAAKVNEITF